MSNLLGLTRGILLRHPVDRAHAGVPDNRPSGQIVDPGTDFRTFERQSQAFLTLRQFFDHSLALGNVAKGDDGAGWFVVRQDRRAGVFDGKAGAVLAPQHLVINAMNLAIGEGCIHVAFFAGVPPGIRHRTTAASHC